MRRSVGAFGAVLVVVAAAVAGLAVTAPGGTADGGGDGSGTNPCVGRVASPATGTTVISVQGARVSGEDRGKRPARIVGVGPRGEIRWVFPVGKAMGIVWSYDVDPLANGHLFVTATRPDRTVFFEFDPRNREVVWTEVLDLVDTHDADLLDEHRILIANMRNYRDGRNRDRLLVYNRTSDEVAWEWLFREHGFPREGGGNYTDDWTHVNDVDRIGEGRYLASVRNFDRVIVVDRATGEVTLSVGSDGDYGVMHEQHNPQYLESESGRPTVLVADSGNDRIVEYERRRGEWERTWTVGSSETLSWPRDADRLPNGNTLIVDSVGHRVIEVTPTGEVVWEFYAPWLVYDAERVAHGDEAGGPTIADQGAQGEYAIDAEARPAPELKACAEALRSFRNPATVTPLSTRTVGSPTPGDVPSESPGTGTPGQPGFGLAAALAALLATALAARYRS